MEDTSSQTVLHAFVCVSKPYTMLDNQTETVSHM